jgi:hypothetical protein
MAYQTTMNGMRFRHAEGVLTNVSEFVGDFSTLAELQIKLTEVDAKEALQRASMPTVGLVIVTAVLMGTLPVLLIGLGFVLATALGISQGAGLLIVGLIVAALAAVLGWFALAAFLKSFESFRRSREEFVRNVNWIRTVLAQSTRTTQHSRS